MSEILSENPAVVQVFCVSRGESALNSARRDIFTHRQVPALKAATRLAMFLALLAFLADVTTAQALQSSSTGDPYQTVAPPSGFGGFPIQIPGVVTLNQANAGVGQPPSVPDLSLTGLFDGQPILGGNRFRNWQPILPQIREGIDNRLYVFGEFLLWDVTGMESPALVTTSAAGTAQNVAGVLGETETSRLFGPTQLNDGGTDGFRFGGGFWITPARNVGIEAEYFWLSDQNDGFSANSNSNPILALPYFNIVSGQQDAYLVAHPDVGPGSVSVRTESDLRSFLINGRISLCDHGTCCQQCGARDRTDLIIGYRHIRLRDEIGLTASSEPSSGTRTARDSFRTTNRFNGLQLGVVRRSLLRRRSWLETSMRVAIGNNEQELSIDGSTTTLAGTALGGVYALRSNIGDFSQDDFVLIPELGIKFGVRLRDHLHVTVGYSVLYLPNVIRASEQIDTDINPNLIPPEAMPLVGASRPRVLFRQSDYFAQGLTLGGELQY
ncbi:MAG: BBP7 family outer membrane beta-barrel protein [Planctomycetota bacterium]